MELKHLSVEQSLSVVAYTLIWSSFYFFAHWWVIKQITQPFPGSFRNTPCLCNTHYVGLLFLSNQHHCLCYNGARHQSTFWLSSFSMEIHISTMDGTLQGFANQPRPCNCKNTCSRTIVKRGGCPCKSDGRSCTDLCKCGSQKAQCVNMMKREDVRKRTSSEVRSDTFFKTINRVKQ